MTIRG
jgi:hypothetical protein